MKYRCLEVMKTKAQVRTSTRPIATHLLLDILSVGRFRRIAELISVGRFTRTTEDKRLGSNEDDSEGSNEGLELDPSELISCR